MASDKNDNFSKQPSVTNCDELLYNFVYDDPPTEGQLEPLPQLEPLRPQMELEEPQLLTEHSNAQEESILNHLGHQKVKLKYYRQD